MGFLRIQAIPPPFQKGAHLGRFRPLSSSFNLGPIGRRLTLTLVVLVTGVALVTGLVLFRLTERTIDRQLGTRLRSVALLAGYYIMGVSQMALELMDSSAHPDLAPESKETWEPYYSDLMNRMNKTWHDWGSHAFFHHINAIFVGEQVLARVRSGLVRLECIS